MGETGCDIWGKGGLSCLEKAPLELRFFLGRHVIEANTADPVGAGGERHPRVADRVRGRRPFDVETAAGQPRDLQRQLVDDDDHGVRGGQRRLLREAEILVVGRAAAGIVGRRGAHRGSRRLAALQRGRSTNPTAAEHSQCRKALSRTDLKVGIFLFPRVSSFTRRMRGVKGGGQTAKRKYVHS